MPKLTRQQGRRPRRVNVRERQLKILIACEGAKTEPNYFEAFRINADVIEVDVRGLGANTLTVVEEAEELSKEREYAQVWCVFDRDSFKLERYMKAIYKAQQLGFNVAYTNEAFELWYLLHFSYIDSALSRAQYKGKLSSAMGRPYKKNDPDIYDLLLDRQPQAIRNAARLFRSHGHSLPAHLNPVTTVHELVLELNKHLR